MERRSLANPFRRSLYLLALVAVMLPGLMIAVPAPVAAQEGGTPATDVEGGATEISTKTINVELILDSSGSMAENATETETKMEAAKRAMAEVINQIPERNGLNVGFRVYGHKGSNREEDRAASCTSTELLVPIEGIDRDRLRDKVNSFRPTGWTPLARSLEASAGDFPTGGQGVTNAVILVTDGEETCGGDPCAVAGKLHAGDISLTTHVVGFGLSAEQKQSVSCIAEEGGGELFEADDADTLSDAVFSALQQLETSEQGYVGGNAFSLLESGDAGEISIIATGPYQESLGLPVVLRNNTGDDVENVSVAAVVRDAEGGLLGQAATTGIFPYVVVDGGVAFGRVYFGVGDLPKGATFEDYEIDSELLSDDPLFLDATVIEADQQGDQIVGRVRNDHEQDVFNLRPAVACFDEDGALLEIADSNPMTAADLALDAGDSTVVGFQPEQGGAGLSGPCPVFLFAAQAQKALP